MKHKTNIVNNSNVYIKEVIIQDHPRIAKVRHVYSGNKDMDDIFKKIIMDYLIRNKILD